MVLAHVKWFIEGGSDIAHYSLHEEILWVWLALGFIFLGLAYVLDQKIPSPPKKFLQWAKKMRPIWVYVFQVLLAISLLFAAWNKVILEPHYAAENWGWSVVETLTALLLLTNRGIGYASILLLATYFGAAMNYGPLEVLDYVNILGIVSFLALSKAPWKDLKPYRKYAIQSLRIFTGLALIVLAFTEKLLAPEQAIALLSEFNMNFMGFSGMEAREFIFCAGAMEAIFGLIMVSGWVTRINVIALAVFLVSSNLFFLIQGHGHEALVELMGHLPVIGTAVLLIIYGKK